MPQKSLYIIAGCNGAGKTTASFNTLPNILNCKEFINADEIAKGISPFNPESVSFEAGRIMLNRISELLCETTLATKSYKNTVLLAQEKGYHVTLLFYWLNDVQLAKNRVALRVQKVDTIFQKMLLKEDIKVELKTCLKFICQFVILFWYLIILIIFLN